MIYEMYKESNTSHDIQPVNRWLVSIHCLVCKWSFFLFAWHTFYILYTLCEIMVWNK